MTARIKKLSLLLQFDSWNALLLYAVTAVSAAIILQSLYAIYRFHDVVPYYDMLLVDYQYLFGSASDFWLFLDNEHRPLAAMPIFWLNLHVFHDQEVFLVACNLAAAACIAALPWRAVVRAARGNRALAVACCALVTALGFWLANRQNLSWPKQIHMYLSVLTMMLAFKRVADPRPVRIRAAVGIATWLSVSTFSFGFGIIGFPAVAIVAGLRRWNWRPLVVLALAMAACIYCYAQLTDGLYFLRTGQASGPFVHTLVFALTFLSAPVVYVARLAASETVAVLVGQCLTAIALLVFAWRTGVCVVRRPTELEAWALLLAAFACGNALQTALARAKNFGMEYALEYRYIIGELPFWTGLVLLAVSPLATASRALALVGSVGGLTIVGSLLVSQQAELDNHRWENSYHWQEAMSALVGVPDRTFYDQRIWQNSDQVIRVFEGLRDKRFSVYSWPQASWIGQPVSQFDLTPQSCVGGLRGSFTIAEGGGSMVLGWSSDKHIADWASWIVLADKNGMITGIAHGGLKDPIAVARTHSFYSGWRGYVRGSAEALTPYLVLPGNRACALHSPT